MYLVNNNLVCIDKWQQRRHFCEWSFIERPLYYSFHCPLLPHSHTHTHTAALNTGIILWLQQFRAMFTKHALNSIRHIVAIVIQLLLPTIFVLLALTLVKIAPNPLEQDPPRNLTVATSIPINSNTKMFYADLRTNASADNFFEVRPHPARMLDHCTYSAPIQKKSFCSRGKHGTVPIHFSGSPINTIFMSERDNRSRDTHYVLITSNYNFVLFIISVGSYS